MKIAKFSTTFEIVAKAEKNNRLTDKFTVKRLYFAFEQIFKRILCFKICLYYDPQIDREQ